mgnify:CR=1 FL=1
MRANELKRGDLVEFDGQSYLVKRIDTRSPSARGASTLYKIRLDNLVTGQKKEIKILEIVENNSVSYAALTSVSNLETLNYDVKVTLIDGSSKNFKYTLQNCSSINRGYGI